MIAHHHPHAGPRARVDGGRGPARLLDAERGAGLVELALVASLLCLLIAGAFDYGFAWRSGLAANEAARTGARVGSGQSLSRGADYYALSGLRASLVSSGEDSRLVKVVIFKSTSANGKVPTSCTNDVPSGTCNVLNRTQLINMEVSSFDLTISSNPAVDPTGTGCLKPGEALLANWCPNARSNSQETGSDYYGVYVELRYRNQFPLLGPGTTVRRTAVMRLEPVGFGG